MRPLLAIPILLLVFTAARAEDKPKPAVEPVGLWLGTLKVGPIELRLAFDISKDQDGKLGGKMISLDQNKAEVPITKAEFAERELQLEVAGGVIRYVGKLDDQGVLVGELEQNKQKFPVKLARIDKLPESNRPQTPKKPYPYPSEDITFENALAKIKLAGTLTVPKGDGPFPAVVLVSGSGPQDRDETLFEHKPFLLIADHLAKRGIACLRYDDRGVAKSGGQFAEATSGDFATDAYAAVKFLIADKRIDSKKVGICGHSEGGMIAPIVAAAHPDNVGFIILLAGPGVSGETIMIEQAVDFSPAEDANTVKALMVELAALVKSDQSTAEVKNQMRSVFDKHIALEKNEKKIAEAKKNSQTSIDAYTAPWFRWFVKHDPAQTLSNVKCPVLALNGGKDVQVKPRQNLDAIELALTKAGHKNFECVEYKGLNHLFQNCKSGQIVEYGQIEETIEPKVLEKISAWILRLK